MKKVLIASVLKPANDSRNFEKVGLSLAESGEYEVFIAGYHSALPDTKKVKFYPLFKFPRLSLKRLFAPVRIFILLLKLKPDIVIATTYELLGVSCLYKKIFRKKVIYDVQEDYYKNLLYMRTVPWGISHILAAFIRRKELLYSPIVDGFILAERVYASDISFTRGRSIIIENKFNRKISLPDRKTPVRLDDQTPLKFAYTGTIAIEYGILEAIDVMVKLQEIRQEISFTIIGVCHSKKLKELLDNILTGLSFIDSDIRASPVPYRQIIEVLDEADLVLLPYRTNQATGSKVPSKMFEALSLKIPMVVQHNKLWESICLPYKAAIFIDFSEPNIEKLSCLLNQTTFYTSLPGREVDWSEESIKLNEWLKNLD